MPRLKERSTVVLRSTLADMERSFRPIAERLDRVGDIGAVARLDTRIRALGDDAPVVVPSWRLAAALFTLGATPAECSAIESRCAEYIVDPDGSYRPV